MSNGLAYSIFAAVLFLGGLLCIIAAHIADRLTEICREMRAQRKVQAVEDR